MHIYNKHKRQILDGEEPGRHRETIEVKFFFAILVYFLENYTFLHHLSI